MENEMISYYELLTIIKDLENEKDYPKVYWYTIRGEKVLYVPSFNCVSHKLEGYHLKDSNKENEDIRYWLSECMLESSMFDKCLEIKRKVERTELDKQISKLQSDIDKLGKEISSYHNIMHSMRDKTNYMKQQLKEIIKLNNTKNITTLINNMEEQGIDKIGIEDLRVIEKE